MQVIRGCVLLAFITAAACGGSTEASREGDGPPSGRLSIVATVSPITNIVANIAGPDADVTGVVPEGRNSHEFEPKPSLARLLAQTDVVFANGLHLEEPTLRLARANLAPGAQIVELGRRTVAEDEWIFDFSFPENAGDPNPHLWTNPPYAREFAGIIADVLAAADPDQASGFRSRAATYQARINAFDASLRTATATVPQDRRKLLTYHDSFPYFARAYGWEVVGAIQPSDFAEPSPKEIVALIEQIRRERVPAIFGSEVFPSPVLEQIGREAGVRYVDELRDDDLPGDPGDPDHSYLGLMRADYVTIVRALGGDPVALESFSVADVVADRARYLR